MKKKIFLSSIAILAFFFLFPGCTGDFESLNTNPYEVSDKSLEQDYNNVGGFFKQLQQYIYNVTTGLQVEQNLLGDAFAQYWVPPTPFQSNRNNVTYKYTWYSSQWDKSYETIMPVLLKFKNNSVDVNYSNFYAWATILKIFTMQRTTDNYGPIIYSQYGNVTIDSYDSQKEVYYSFFNELDAAVDTLAQYAEAGSTAFSKFDYSPYGGDVASWIKVANSLRLRLAMRIVKVDATKAQEEAEKAISNSYGVLTDADADFTVKLGSYTHPIQVFSDSWNDTRMCATMESVLKGYNDPRLAVYYAPATDADFTGTYKGIRQGIDISSKSTYVNFSAAGDMFESATTAQVMTVSEIYFLRAEGALRGWNMGGGSAETYYNKGIETSFAQYGLSSSYSTYVNDNTSTFADYVDPKNAVNNFSASSDVTIKWEDSDTNEKNLERIMTQKWIALFPDGQEAWSEFRRTGYPKLIPVVVNYSGGTISTDEFVRRVPYPTSEYEEEESVVEDAVNTYFNGNDTGGERVWWDVKSSSNF